MKTSPEKVAQALRASLKESERLRQRNRRLRDAASEPIAIVGMSCRYPGGASSPAKLWELLAAGEDAITGFPNDRGWDLELVDDIDSWQLGKSYVSEGGFLHDAADFDHGFFGISSLEAQGMDPQQRILLEVAWEALEDAGVDPRSLRGTQTGVFAGAMYNDYGWGLSPAQESSIYLSPGAGSSPISGRIAYLFGLEGPTITVDTACSSSLVALHLATQALRAGECSLALAGGVSVYGTPAIFIQFCALRVLSPDGRCKSFAEVADGAGFSEGAGVLLLERLSDAQRNGHRVLATIRGSAVNQDGASNGFTAPNGPAQERLIRQALDNARLAAEEIDVVEAHGTGTALGDPIEANALLATYGAGRPEGRPLRLGSVKSNIGHAQAAAGVAGVMKMVLALREGVLPKTLHADEPSSKIDWSGGEIELLTEPLPWEAGARPRRAGVSSFGATGTNAHLILEEALALESTNDAGEESGGGTPTPQPLPGPTLLPLSAKTEPALREAAERLATHLRQNPELDPTDVAHSLATTRSSFEHRAVAVGTEREELLATLTAYGRGEEQAAIAQGRAATEGKPVFLFPGQGSQWEGMALGLLDSSPVFAAKLHECSEALKAHTGWSVQDVLRGAPGAPSLELVEVVQPALFAVTVALAELWRSCGVQPAAVVGHSQGEIAAAYVAGALTLEDAARLVAVRVRLIATLAGQGGLISVGLSADLLASRLAQWEGRIEVAAINGPSSTVASGERGALDELLAQCAEEGIRARDIPAAVTASHSAYIEVLREELMEEIASTSPRQGEIPFHSTVTGELIDGAELNAEYWYRNMREPVRFEGVMRGLLEQGQRVLVEISPHPVLNLALQETVEDALSTPSEATVLGTLRREEGGPVRFALSLAKAHAAGADINWHSLFKGTGAKRVPLPTYPFQRKRYWLSASTNGGDPASIGQSDADHPLLGATIEDPRGEGLTLTGRLSLSTHPWLADHAVTDTVLLPGTAFLELALRAGEQAGTETVEELTLQAPLILPPTGAVQIQVQVSGEEEGRREIAIHSRPDSEESEEWTCHAQGLLSGESAKAPEPLDVWPPTGAEPLDVEGLYERLADLGFQYGPAFQGTTAAWRQGEQIFAEVSLPEEHSREAERFAVHPALFDSTGHAGIAVMLGAAETVGEEAKLALPFSWRGISVFAPGASSLQVRISLDQSGSGIEAFDETGAPVLAVESVVMREVEPSMLEAAAARRLPLHNLQWPVFEPQPTNGSEPPSLAILGESEPQGITAEPYADLAALVEAITSGVPAPDVLIAACAPGGEKEDPLDAAHTAAAETLALLQAWIAAEGLGETRLCLLTNGAVAAAEGEAPDLATAPLWGLFRSAQSEHPDRFALIDTDDSELSRKALAAALAAGPAEPQIALREGRTLVPRLARTQPPEEPVAAPIDPERTILITGGTSGLGALLARHLTERHGAQHLLLASRSGEEAAGAVELRAELEAAGAQVTIAACDVSERPQLQELLDSIPEQHPLGAVIHSAGVLDDGVLESLDPERLERVMRPKADAAWHLHELTDGMELSAFVVFSSVMGIIGGAGQANYAAANTFLDALAAHRQARGLPASSLAWGGWALENSLTAGSESEAELMRFAKQVRERIGLVPMSPEEGLELFDAAVAHPDPLLTPAAFDKIVLRGQASSGTLPAILRGLVPAQVRRHEGGSLAKRLASVPEAERQAFVLALVRSHAAAVLGQASGETIEPAVAFKDLGLDSLAAVELRNRLVAATGLALAPTIVFDYPSPAALAKFIHAEVAGKARAEVSARRPIASNGEPVAIVGMACRYPGGAASPRELWTLVADGTDAISPLPDDRGWDLERIYHPEPGRLGTSYVRDGGFVREAAHFDAGFFGISPREALVMDPQERALLEACWEALEDGGIDPHQLRGTAAGVFAGVMYQDYGIADYGTGPGMSSSGVSGRVAYSLGLEGPAMTIDTACSSSLVAMHLAAQALRSGECSLALAGGVTILSTPGIFTFFSLQRGLAVDGRCKAFADSADGTAISEGTGVLLLERLSDAEQAGHSVLAVIKGSAVNQDGASNGFTAPNGPSQERVIRQALANANLSPKDIDAVEAHGTGTTLGDPIEAGALLATYGQDREEPLKLGSIKSNIGHTQAAAGVAGVIKMVAAMRERVLPKTLHVDAPSSKVEWEAGKIELLTEHSPWEPNGRPRRAGVSSFGASGTNAHLILEEAPAPAPAKQGGEEDSSPEEQVAPLPGPLLLPLSAKTEPALANAAERLAAHIRQNPDLSPTDISYSLATTRSSFERRAVAMGEGREQLLGSLAVLAEGSTSAKAIAATAAKGKLAYLFTGQGSQRAAMGKELYEADPVFRGAFEAVCEQLDLHLQTPLKEIVFGESEEALDDTTYAQPALFALQVALFRALESRGLSPDFLTGHSVGEISAAHLAGVLSLPDAAKLIAARGRLMGALPKGGAMVAIQITEQEAAEYLAGKEKELSIAAVNSPSSTVLSGEGEAIEQAQAHFEEQGKKTKRLAVSHAFHSPLIDPMLEEFEQLVRSLELHSPQIPIISNLSGELLSEEQAKDPAYWVTHARQPVRFADAIATLEAQGTSAYLELGPDPVLCAMAEQCLGEEDQGALIATLREGRDEADALALSLAAAHANGAKLNWEDLFKGTGAKRVPLPTYPFQRKRYWLTSSGGAGDLTAAGQSSADHPLLGAAVELAGGEGESLLLTGRLSLATHPWLADHAVADTVLLPGTGFLELALRAGEQAGTPTIEELTLQAPLILPESGAVQIQVSVSGPGEDGKREIAIHSRPGGAGEDDLAEAPEWTCHAQGVLSGEAIEAPESLASWPPTGAEPMDVKDLYGRLEDLGLRYGPAFQGLGAAWKQGEEVFAEVSLSEEHSREAERFGVHPALFDSTGHAGIAVMLGAAETVGEEAKLALPFSWRGISVFAPGASSLRVRISLDQSGIEAFDETGAPVLAVESVVMRQVEPSMLEAAAARRLPLHNLQWPVFESQSANGSEPPSLAIIGETEPQGITAERYADLTALVEAITSGAPAPDVVIAAARATGGEDPLDAAHAAAEETLALLQAWIAAEGLGEARLCLLTNGAVAAAEGEAPDLATAPLWGLLRSAQSEHPGRFALIDTDDAESSHQALGAALAAGAEEPQIALREGRTLVPHLARTQPPEEHAAVPIDPERTVLITGGTSGLGALLARHLTEHHGAQHLLLASRSGEEAAGAAELKAELEAAGAQVRIAACDVSERPQLQELLDSIPQQYPLGAVVHSAGVLDDGVLESLDPERLERVMRPKADAAWHLHELTEGMELSGFVLFSSAAGILGAPGQANYAAANTFLDALAAHRQAGGLPASSLAWGGWAQQSNMTGDLDEATLARVARLGIFPIAPELGLELFDVAVECTESLLVPVSLDSAALRRLASAGALPGILRGLVRSPARPVRRESLAKRLAGVPEAEWSEWVLTMVRTHVATVLGHATAEAIDPEVAFSDLGFDSLAAVELRNRLSAATSLRLPPTLVFDYPSSAAVAEHLLAEVGSSVGGRAAEGSDQEAEEVLARLAAMLPSIKKDDRARDLVGSRLQALLGDLLGSDPDQDDGEDLASMSHEEMFELIDEELGTS